MAMWERLSNYLFGMQKKPESGPNESAGKVDILEVNEKGPHEFQVVTQYKGKKIRTNVFTFSEKLLGEVKG